MNQTANPTAKLNSNANSNTPARQARGLWTLFEPVHAVSYFTAEGRAGFEAAGLRGFWRAYFAGRTAPLGPVGPAPVTALYFTFSPVPVARALPAVWELIDPQAALAARAAGAAAALRALTGDVIEPAGVAALADRLWPAATAVESSGRALGAANAALARPDDPYAALWQAATTLREHRGDGHLAALVGADLTGLETLALRCSGDLVRAVLQPARGWDDEEWDGAVERLRARELIGPEPESALTPAGWDLLTEVEATTDRVAVRPWADLAATGELIDLAETLHPVAAACRAGFPQPNPIGLGPIWDVSADPGGIGWSGGPSQVS